MSNLLETAVDVNAAAAAATLSVSILPAGAAVKIGETSFDALTVQGVITHALHSAGEDYGDDGERAALLDVYLNDPTLFGEDLAAFTAAAPAAADAADAAAVADIAAAAAAVASKKATTHETAVNDIVNLILAKFEDEGERNFAIGKRASEHAQWQRGNFDGYKGCDFDNLMNRVRDDVRIHVAISPASIKVGEWVRCYVLRQLVADAIGADQSRKLSFFEYRSIYAKALSFSKSEVSGELVNGWLDFVKEIASVRTSGGRITSEDFFARGAKHVAKLAAAAAATDPVAAAAKLASAAIKEKTAAVAKANKDITSALSDGLSGGHISADGALNILENVAKHHGIPLPSAIGFDPAKCTIADCDLLASTMFQAGKYAEMVHLRDRLDKMVSAVEKARAAANTHAPAAVKISA